MATLKEVDSEAGFDQMVWNASPSTLFVLYFHTPWAAPCAQMNTILSTLASTYPADSDISFLSINAEELADISESYDVTAVPFLVLQKGGKTLETVSGSDATKVRTAVEKYAGAGSGAGGKAGIPPPLQATPQEPAQTNGNGNATKDLSSYAPKESDPQTAPEMSSGQPSREELDERLSKLVKAA
jgi:thioredoxin-like negative regulator of GroEL